MATRTTKENLTKAFKLIDESIEGKAADNFLDKAEIGRLIGALKRYEGNPDDCDESSIEVQLSRLGLNGSAMERLISYVNVADDDGKVSLDEFFRVIQLDEQGSGIYNLFRSMDTSKKGEEGRGTVSYEEAIAAIGTAEFKSEFQRRKMVQIIEGLKTDEDGQLTYEEFYDLWMKQMAGISEEKLKIFEIFTKMDTDNSGYLVFDELIKGFDAGPLKEMISLAQLRDLCHHIKTVDEDGRISIEELADYMEFYQAFKELNKLANGEEDGPEPNISSITLDKDDCRKIFREGRSKYTTGNCRNLYYACKDTDGEYGKDGKIDFNEFCKIWKMEYKKSQVIASS